MIHPHNLIAHSTFAFQRHRFALKTRKHKMQFCQNARRNQHRKRKASSDPSFINRLVFLWNQSIAFCSLPHPVFLLVDLVILRPDVTHQRHAKDQP